MEARRIVFGAIYERAGEGRISGQAITESFTSDEVKDLSAAARVEQTLAGNQLNMEHQFARAHSEQYIFMFHNTAEFIYLCVAEKGCQPETISNFLKEIKRYWLNFVSQPDEEDMSAPLKGRGYSEFDSVIREKPSRLNRAADSTRRTSRQRRRSTLSLTISSWRSSGMRTL